jgi:hypothetical protein
VDGTTGNATRGCALDCSKNPLSVSTPHAAPFCMNTTRQTILKNAKDILIENKIKIDNKILFIFYIK